MGVHRSVIASRLPDLLRSRATAVWLELGSHSRGPGSSAFVGLRTSWRHHKPRFWNSEGECSRPLNRRFIADRYQFGSHPIFQIVAAIPDTCFRKRRRDPRSATPPPKRQLQLNPTQLRRNRYEDLHHRRSRRRVRPRNGRRHRSTLTPSRCTAIRASTTAAERHNLS
jgi:hypothetical protein